VKPNILHHNGLGFVIIPKCGGTSIKCAVREGMGLDASQRIHADDRLKYTFSPEGLELVAFIRNPFDRIVSAYTNKIVDDNGAGFERLKKLGFRKDMTFPQFVAHLPGKLRHEGHITTQCRYLPKANTRLYRFEDMSSAWDEIRAQHDWLPVLPHKNRSSKSDWQSYYTPEAERLIAELYQKDIALWHSL